MEGDRKTNLQIGRNGMNILVSANNTNGNLPGHQEWFDTVEQAKRHADWLHTQSALCNVEITEPLGVLLTHANGTKAFGQVTNPVYAEALKEVMDVRESWQAVIGNRKINRTRVTKAEIVGLPTKTAIATPEDALIGDWMALALEDHLIKPSMKYDLNRWLDSKEWI